MEKATIIFQPSGSRGKIFKGKTVLEAAREIGENIESLCGGKGICGKCRILISEGHYPKYGIDSRRKNLSGWQKTETKFIDKKQRTEGFRLACRAAIKGDVLAFVPEESRAAKQVVSKSVQLSPTPYDPIIEKYELIMNPPSAKGSQGDLERLVEALGSQYGLEDLGCDIDSLYPCDIEVLRNLPSRLREQNWHVTASVWMDREIIRIQPGRVLDSFGIAVDIGTTTVVASLVHLNAMKIIDTQYIMNPQVKYGEDVISRINHHVNNKDGLGEMSADIIEALNRMIDSLLCSTWPDSTCFAETADAFNYSKVQKQRAKTQGKFLCLIPEDIEDVTIVGNTIMHHIFLKLDPGHVARSPFPPVVQKGLNIKAKSLGLNICPSAYVHLLPNEAGFVGADNVAVLTAEAPYKSDQIQLIIDIGTNGELVLGNKERLLSTSCATGPAFEGAEITFGMRAAPGAIERINIDPETHEVVYKVVGHDAWSNYVKPGELQVRGICGSGIMDLLAELYRSGIITKSGAFQQNLTSPRFRINPDTKQREFVIARANETVTSGDITITQKDIRQIQLAKAAIYAGCKLLMREWGTDRVDVVKIAGGFGIHIDPFKALIMGMIPDCDPHQIIPIGNAAGAGALVTLLNREKRSESDWVAQMVEYVDLASLKGFKDEFLEALYIPHKKDPFPHLEKILPSKIRFQR
ncbi:MAG: ASKHA domain-containing protein [Desulfobacterales bacterium]